MKETIDTFKKVLQLANLNVWEWNLKTKELKLINTTYRQSLKDISPLMVEKEATISNYPQVLIDRGLVKGNAISMLKEQETMIYNCKNEEEVSFRIPFRNRYDAIVWLQFKGAVYLDEKEQPDYAIGCYTDISSELEVVNTGTVDSLIQVEKESHQYMGMIKGLALEYANLFLINLKDESFTTFRLNDITNMMIREQLALLKSYKDVLRYYFKEYVIEEDRARLQCLFDAEQIRSMLKEKGYFNINYRSFRANELAYCQFKVAIGNVNDDEIVLGVRNINEEVHQKELLEKASRQDGLTGLLNRSAFESDIMQELYSGKIHTVGFMFIDLDNFKTVNDTLGHAMGDAVIAQTAERLKYIFRKSDIIGRYGGDEFCVFIENIPKDILIKRCEKCLQALKRTYTKDDKSVQISASIAVAYYSQYDKTKSSILMEQADAAMYEAKNTGRNQYILKEYGSC